MADKLSTSVLVIGKSGVGKSSLLNYMFGESVEKTGTGRPVTEKGIYPHEYKHKDNFNINIYDTWGLEPDKTGEWLKIIKTEVEKHDRQDISEWFNTIIFCFNKNWARVEEFESKIIQYLLDGKNNLVIAITNCNTADLNENQGMVDQLVASTSITRDKIINISSVAEEFLDGTITKQFGKDKIFGAIVDNLWVSICGKLPKILKDDVQRNIAKKRKECLDRVNKKITVGSALIDKIGFLNNLSASKTLDDFGTEISDEIMKFGSGANKLINAKLEEANNYYLDLYNCYNNQISIEQRRELRVNIKCDFLKDYQHELKGVITFSDLKNVKGEFKKLFQYDDKHVTSKETIKEIINRLAFNWKSVNDKRNIAVQKINQCFDELESEFNKGIDEKIDKINNLYLML